MLLNEQNFARENAPSETTETVDTTERRPNDIRRPFDNSSLERLPRPAKKDPPYRPWWVVE